MSYDLMVFEKTKVPKSRTEFMKWYEGQIEWSEDHDYRTISVSSPSLQNWFMDMIAVFPPMNGQYSPKVELLEGNEDLERHTTDYCIGRDVIYAAFSWSCAEEAIKLVKFMANKHSVGFFDVSSSNGDIIFPEDMLLEGEWFNAFKVPNLKR